MSAIKYKNLPPPAMLFPTYKRGQIHKVTARHEKADYPNSITSRFLNAEPSTSKRTRVRRVCHP